jgi:hypothetical protein
MKAEYNLHVTTRAGVQDLSRVAGVLALYELTPHLFRAFGGDNGLEIEILLQADQRTSELCVSRMNALAAVIEATALVAHGQGKDDIDGPT